MKSIFRLLYEMRAADYNNDPVSSLEPTKSHAQTQDVSVVNIYAWRSF